MAEEKAKAVKKPNILVRALAAVVTLALVLGAVGLVVFRDSWNIDALKRRITYRSIARSDSGQAASFLHEGTIRDVFAAPERSLLVCSTAGVRLYSESGTCYVEKGVSFSEPTALAAGAWAVAYDLGGRDLCVFHGREEAYDLEIGGEDGILSARINAAGQLAVTARETGYKGTATVYDPTGARVLAVRLSSRFLMDAVVTGDGKTLAAAAVGQSGGSFDSSLLLYRLDGTGESAEPDASCSLGNDVVLDLAGSGSAVWAVGESGVYAVSAQGELLANYDYGSLYLKEYSLGGEDFAVVLTGKYRTGTSASLTAVHTGETGSVTIPVREQVLSLSAAGRYVAVLTADRLDIYTSDLAPYATLTGTGGARKVLMRGDGTALLLNGSTAQLYIPA